MKKIVSVVLALILVLSLAACGGGGTTGPSSTINNTATNTAESNTAQEDSKGNAVENTASTENTATQPADNGSKENDSKDNDKSDTSKDNPYTIADEVLVDDDNCKFTIVSGQNAPYDYVEFKVLAENKTADKTLDFSIDNVAVNGWAIDPYFYTTVTAGKKTNDKLEFDLDDFKACGFDTADKIEFTLRVYDDKDWSADDFVNEKYTIYPTGMSDADVKSPDRPTSKDEVVIVDDDNCTMIILGPEDDDWGYSLAVYLENKTDSPAYFNMDEVSVNGFMIDPFFSETIPAGKKALSSISFSNSDLEENDLKEEDLEEMEFKLRVYDDEDWMKPDYVADTFTYTIKK